MKTGDYITGTVGGSGLLSIIMLCAIAMITAFYAKGRMPLWAFAVLTLVCLAPASINETTVTIVLLPFAIAIPFLFVGNWREFVRKLIPIGTVGVVLFSAYIAVYSSNYTRWGGDVMSVFTSDAALSYIYRGADEKSRADGGREMSEIGAAGQHPDAVHPRGRSNQTHARCGHGQRLRLVQPATGG